MSFNFDFLMFFSQYIFTLFKKNLRLVGHPCKSDYLSALTGHDWMFNAASHLSNEDRFPISGINFPISAQLVPIRVCSKIVLAHASQFPACLFGVLLNGFQDLPKNQCLGNFTLGEAPFSTKGLLPCFFALLFIPQ